MVSIEVCIFGLANWVRETISKTYRCHTYIPRDTTTNDSTSLEEAVEPIPLEIPVVTSKPAAQ